MLHCSMGRRDLVRRRGDDRRRAHRDGLRGGAARAGLGRVLGDRLERREDRVGVVAGGEPRLGEEQGIHAVEGPGGAELPRAEEAVAEGAEGPDPVGVELEVEPRGLDVGEDAQIALDLGRRHAGEALAVHGRHLDPLRVGGELGLAHAAGAARHLGIGGRPLEGRLRDADERLDPRRPRLEAEPRQAPVEPARPGAVLLDDLLVAEVLDELAPERAPARHGQRAEPLDDRVQGVVLADRDAHEARLPRGGLGVAHGEDLLDRAPGGAHAVRLVGGHRPREHGAARDDEAHAREPHEGHRRHAHELRADARERVQPPAQEVARRWREDDAGAEDLLLERDPRLEGGEIGRRREEGLDLLRVELARVGAGGREALAGGGEDGADARRVAADGLLVEERAEAGQLARDPPPERPRHEARQVALGQGGRREAREQGGHREHGVVCQLGPGSSPGSPPPWWARWRRLRSATSASRCSRRARASS
ncbi:MAG: hypothetical protein H6745_26675 [Deltaproteobacteria bacterium]|nr:hypothetical protein [Deltaproteobacteria bacterium]